MSKDNLLRVGKLKEILAECEDDDVVMGMCIDDGSGCMVFEPLEAGRVMGKKEEDPESVNLLAFAPVGEFARLGSKKHEVH